MLISFLTLAYPQDSSIRNLYSDLFDEIVDRGHEVIVFNPDEKRILGDAISKMRGKVKVVQIPTGQITKAKKLKKLINLALLNYRYNRVIKKYINNKIDLLIYSTPPINFLGVIKKLKKVMNCSTYLLLKDIFPQNAVDIGLLNQKSIAYKYFRKKEKELYEISDRIGCMSPANVRFLLENNSFIEKSKVHENPNSIKPSTIEFTSSEKAVILEKYSVPQNSLKLVYGGNFGLPQGIDYILKVLKALSDRQDVFTLLIGDGTQYEKIAKFIEKEKFKNVQLIKSLPQSEYKKLLFCMDVGLIFLDYRFKIPNFPSRILDYMEAGLPILAATDPNTDVGEIIQKSGAGLWCYSNQINNYLECIDKMKDENYRLAAGHASQKLLMERYTVSYSANIILENRK